MNTKIYSVFPACGKTWMCEHQEGYGLKILDSDSSQFSWMERPVTFKTGDHQYEKIIKLRNPDFPANYIKHIRDNIGKYDYIFVSSHASVREALDTEGIEFKIVYHEHHFKAEWVGRCYIREKRGETGCGAEVMYNNWDQWVRECFNTGTDHKEIVLSHNEFLGDYFWA